MFWEQLFFLLFSFLLGTVLFSYHLPLWLKHVDIVSNSSDHNPGTSNAFRLAGVPVGVLCLIFDLGKGFLPVWLSIRTLGPLFPMLPLVMLGPVLGHAISPWYSFRGGKAIAAAFGVLIGLLPYSTAVWVLVFWYLFFSLVVVIHPNERRSVITFLFFALCCAGGAFITRRFILAAGCALVAAVPIHKNYVDIRRAESELRRIPFQQADSKPEPRSSER